MAFTLFSKKSLALNALLLISTSVCAAQTVSIVSGNGQLVRSYFQSNVPLTVLVRDALGNPLPHATVTFTLSGQGTLLNNTVVTDNSGQASTLVVGAALFGTSTAFVASTVTASIGSSSVVFTFTTFGVDAHSAALIQVVITNPQLSNPIPPGAAGSSGTSPITVHVQSINSSQVGGIPNVGISLTATSGSATIACQGGTVLSNSNGDASCTPVFGSTPGSGSFTIHVGNYSDFSNFPFSVVIGQPGLISINSGNNQTGIAGTTLPLPLVATVTDASGNPLPNIPVVFETVNAGTATFTNLRSTSDSSGKVSANVILGNTAGPVQIRVRAAQNSNVASIFTLTETLALGGLVKISGDTQTTLLVTNFANPLIVQVNDTNGHPVQGTTVQFALTSGSATLSNNSAVTNSAGQATINIAGGTTAGPVVVTATVSTISVSFSLTVTQPGPVVTSSSFYNGAGFQQGGIAPGGIVTIVGAGIAPTLQGSIVSPNEIGLLPNILAGVSVTFNGVQAPIYNVSNVSGRQSVTVQVPFETQPGAVPVVVNVNGAMTTVTVTVLAVSPGIFEYIQLDGVKRGILLHGDGSLVTPANPANRGETLRMFATGLGQTSPAMQTNQFSPLGIDPMVALPVIVGVANEAVPVLNSIYARNLLGVYEIQFLIPNDIPSGSTIPLAIAVRGGNGNLVFGNSSLITVK